MLKSIAEISLKSKVNRKNDHIKKQFLPWDRIEKIAIVISKHDDLNKSEIDRFIETTQKYTEIFFVELDSKLPTYSDWHCFSKKDKSLLKLPKNNLIKELKTKRFDLVINTSTEDDLFSMALSSSLLSVIQCDSSDRFNNANLIIKKKENYSIINYLEEVIKYLKMIKN